MRDYSKVMIDSDLDAFKNSGVIETAALVFSGSIGGGVESVQTASLTLDEPPDFYEIFFDNSAKHAGRYKSMRIVPFTLIHESTLGSELGVDLTVIVSGNTITIRGSLFNPYVGAVTLDATTLNFRYIPYESTI